MKELEDKIFALDENIVQVIILESQKTISIHYRKKNWFFRKVFDINTDLNSIKKSLKNVKKNWNPI